MQVPVRRALEVAVVFARLGCMSFGGPVAHLGYFHAEIVERRRWIDDAHFGDLVALCQFLPGPASSQVVFALGMHRAGIVGAILASICFTLPSAILMIGFAYGVAGIADLRSAGWLHGLKVAAVAVVAHAVWGMAQKLWTDRRRVAIGLLAALAIVALPHASVQVGAMAVGAIVGWALDRRAVAPREEERAGARGRVAALAALALFAGLLVALPVLAAATGRRDVAVVDGFYRAGALVFGGGHVVLPLLRAEIVPRGWLSDDAFLAGYGAAQAIPGPLFTFAAYLGAAMNPGRHAWRWGIGCLVAIFLPAWLLIGGALPFWQRLRAKAWARAALGGANAAVVGVLLAALYHPIVEEGIHDVRDVVAAVVAFAALHRKAPPWFVVFAMAAVGQWLLPGYGAGHLP